jgi:hypothetical protein
VNQRQDYRFQERLESFEDSRKEVLPVPPANLEEEDGLDASELKDPPSLEELNSSDVIEPVLDPVPPTEEVS